MSNLIAFFVRYYRLFLFLLLQSISLYLVINFNKYQSAALFDYTYEASGKFYAMYDEVNQYFNLLETNNQLLAENARLRTQLLSSKYADTARQHDKNDTVYKQKFSFIPSQVINNSVNNKNNYLTLDIGSEKNINKLMGVVSPEGIVGITRNVSPHFSTVLSVLHSEFNLSAEIADIKVVGTITWDGRYPDEMILKDIPIQAKAHKGQVVVTSQYSVTFPYGTPVGVIKSVEMGETFFNIRVKLFADMRNVRKVYVVNNIMKKEQETVEQKSKEEEK
ncbi:MAG: rod shape-determining protein MreC [Bacteroidetes bacterium]|nr:rod shape-determining protein MreC [Bacteroidota bacterium]